MDLKRLGFDWPCVGFYETETSALYEGGGMAGREPRNHNSFNQIISAPTLDLACKWLRETQDVHVVPDVTRDDTGDGKWYWTVVYVPFDLQDTESLHFCSWEEAQLHGIREAIEWLSGNLHKCLKCGGQGKPSKALLDEMERLCTEDALELGGHIEAPSGAVKMVNCTKCESCGHSWVENSRKKTNRS